jgi:hypothetical protein
MIEVQVIQKAKLFPLTILPLDLLFINEHLFS